MPEKKTPTPKLPKKWGDMTPQEKRVDLMETLMDDDEADQRRREDEEDFRGRASNDTDFA